MKRSAILLCFAIFISGCAHFQGPTKKSHLTDDLLLNLSSDLAEINQMIESAKIDIGVPPAMVKIIEPWKTDLLAQKLKLTSPSQQNFYEVISISKIEVPSKKGNVLVSLAKLKDKNQNFIGVLDPNLMGKPIASATKMIQSDPYTIKFYDPDLGYDNVASASIVKYISFSSRVEKKTKQIMEKLLEIKQKYLNSPIYIEGFSLSLPILSVEIQFKFI